MRRTTILPFIASCSLVLIACGKKDAQPEAGAKSKVEGEAKVEGEGEAKAGGEAKAEGDEAKAAAAGTPPAGRAAADNDKSIIAALAAIESCKINEEDEDIDEACEGYEKFGDVVVDASDKDAKATDRTLINLLGDEQDVVRCAAIQELGDAWHEDDALVATMFMALGAEKNVLIAEKIGYELGGQVDSEALNGKFLPNVQAALSSTTSYEVFDELYPPVMDCADVKACTSALLAIAKGGATLEIRTAAASETLQIEHFDAEVCAVVAGLIPELSKQPVPKEDDDDVEFFPHDEASQLISNLGSVSVGEDEAKAETCAAVIPGMIDALMPQVVDGSIHEEVAQAMLYLGDDGAKKESYMEKVKAFATAAKDSAKLEQTLKDDAKDALESWNEG